MVDDLWLLNESYFLNQKREFEGVLCEGDTTRRRIEDEELQGRDRGLDDSVWMQ